VARQEHIWCKVGQDVAILNVSRGIYYGLNETAAEIWNALKAPTSFQSITQLLVSQFQVSKEQAASDTQALLNQMIESGLISIQDAPC
jgi:hypothetical protein